MTSPANWSVRSIIAATLLMALLTAIVLFVVQYAQIVFTILLALTLSVAVEPLVVWLQAHKVRRATGSLLVYLALLAVVAATLIMTFPLVFTQINTISVKLPDYYIAIRATLADSPATLLRIIGAQLPLSAEDLLASLINTDSQTETSAWLILSQVSGVFFDVLIIFLLSYYWTLDSDRAIRFLLLRTPEHKREAVREWITTFKDKVGAYIRGQSLLCLVVGGLAVLAYWGLQMPYALSLGVLFGLFEAVPMIGPIIGLVPALLLALAVAPEKLIWVLMAGIVIQQVENNLLVPRVMDRAVGVNPVVSILAIGAFSLLFGVTGALLAVPVTAVLQVLLDRLVFSNPNLLATAEGNLAVSAPIVSTNGAVGISATSDSTTNPETATQDAQVGLQPAARDALSVLHMELHELTQDIRKQQRSHAAPTSLASDEIEDALETAAGQLYELIARHINEQSKPNAPQSSTQ